MFRFFVCGLVIALLSACNLQQTEPEPTATLPINNALPVSVDEQSPNLCYLSPYGIGAPFEIYDAPSSDSTQRNSVATIDTGQLYAVLSRTDLWFQIVAAEGVIGWIQYGIGELTGNCDSLPMASFRPPTPEGVCAVYFDSVSAEDNLYVNQVGTEVLAPMVANQYLTVEARGSLAGWRVRLSDGRTGWLLTPDQLLYSQRAFSGDCETLPVEESDVIGG